MWKRKFNIKIAIVDYLQLLSDNTVRQSWAGNRLYIKKIKRIGKRARFHTIAYLSYPRWKHVVLVNDLCYLILRERVERLSRMLIWFVLSIVLNIIILKLMMTMGDGCASR
jgi:hypothetical protein